ncbi:MAG: hypothetical protein HYY42_02710 [Chloroflexi bacterium]|nr:hypothetical protein [Chloroflexota bacterium]
MQKNAIVLRVRAGLLAALVGLVMLLSALPVAAGGPPTRVHPPTPDPTNITWE